MNKLEETIGFLKMLKVLNKTNVEIELIMPILLEMQEVEINYTRYCETLKTMKTVSFKKWLSLNFTERSEKDGVYRNNKNGKYNTKEKLKERFKTLKDIIKNK